MFILFASFEPKLESGRQPLAVWRFNQNTHHFILGMSQHISDTALCFRAPEDTVITFWGNDRALNKWYPTDPMKRERLEEALRPPPGCMTSQQVAKIFCQDARPHLPIHDQKGGAVIASANRLRAAINREGGLMKASVAEQYVTRHVRGGLNLKQWLEKYPEFGIVWNHRDHSSSSIPFRTYPCLLVCRLRECMRLLIPTLTLAYTHTLIKYCGLVER